MDISISSQFDSGNIQFLSHDPIVEGAPESVHTIRLRIRPDSNAEFLQWFHFRVSNAQGVPLRLIIDNAGECSYADGWNGYQCAASYDRKAWLRVPNTRYDGKQLIIEFTPQREQVWLAYFEPYSHERHQDLVARCNTAPGVQVRRFGGSVQGRDLDLVRVGEPEFSKRRVWVVARQHPGESMAEWCAEGLLDRLLDATDPTAREILQRAVVYVVPNLNPDGAALGNLRANAAGANLNREWMNPTLDRSPEIWHVQQAMRDTGVDLFLDLHGDETLPYVFIDGSHMVPGYGERNLALQAAFLEGLKLASPDFQTEHGYADNRFDDELLTLGSKWTAHTFKCVALTLEMPFKDNANAPDRRTGWNGARSQRMGAALLQPILTHLRALGRRGQA